MLTYVLWSPGILEVSSCDFRSLHLTFFCSRQPSGLRRAIKHTNIYCFNIFNVNILSSYVLQLRFLCSFFSSFSGLPSDLEVPDKLPLLYFSRNWAIGFSARPCGHSGIRSHEGPGEVWEAVHYQGQVHITSVLSLQSHIF